MHHLLREWRHRRYIQRLVRRGLRLGEGVYLNDGFFLDPAHCFLIEIGDGVVFGPGVSVFAHDASSKKVVGKTRVGRVVIEPEAFIGARTVILPGVRIGARSIVGANSTVTRSVPPRELWAGAPARPVMLVSEYRAKLLEETRAQPSLAHLTPTEMVEHLDHFRYGFLP